MCILNKGISKWVSFCVYIQRRKHPKLLTIREAAHDTWMSHKLCNILNLPRKKVVDISTWFLSKHVVILIILIRSVNFGALFQLEVRALAFLALWEIIPWSQYENHWRCGKCRMLLILYEMFCIWINNVNRKYKFS